MIQNIRRHVSWGKEKLKKPVAILTPAEIEIKKIQKEKRKREAEEFKKKISDFFLHKGLSPFVFEYQFHPVRKWRMDVAWPDHRIFIEIQGGIFVKGRHTQGAELLKEWEKLNTAASMGWRVLFVQPVDIFNQDFISLIRQTLQHWK